MIASLDYEKCPQRRQRKTTVAIPALPHRLKVVLQREASKLIEHQKIRPLSIVRAAHQSNVALPCPDARVRDTYRVDTGRFLSHERPRRACHAVNNGDISRQQVRELG